MSTCNNLEQQSVVPKGGVIILVLGETGVGKSAFINCAANDPHRTREGHDLEPCTLDVNSYTIKHPRSGKSMVFVDTPGFNEGHTMRDDITIWEQILTWLDEHCSADMEFGGVIYIHDIQQPPTRPRQNMSASKVPRSPKVVIATVRNPNPGRELKLQQSYLKDLRIERFDRTYSTAWKLVDVVHHATKHPVPLSAFRKELSNVVDSFGMPTDQRRDGPKSGVLSFLFAIVNGFGGARE